MHTVIRAHLFYKVLICHCLPIQMGQFIHWVSSLRTERFSDMLYLEIICQTPLSACMVYSLIFSFSSWQLSAVQKCQTFQEQTKIIVLNCTTSKIWKSHAIVMCPMSNCLQSTQLLSKFLSYHIDYCNVPILCLNKPYFINLALKKDRSSNTSNLR